MIGFYDVSELQKFSVNIGTSRFGVKIAKFCEYWEKLENICSIYASYGLKFSTRVVHNLMKDIRYHTMLNMTQTRHFRAK